MIAFIKHWLACRKLERLVAERKASFAIMDYKRRRAAMLKVTRA